MRLRARLMISFVSALLAAGTVLAPAAVGDEPVLPLPAPSQAEPRIVGGSEASIEDYPWVVALITGAGAPYCGGTLAAPDRVVTAAHCMAGTAPTGIRVVAGRADMRTNDGVVSLVHDVWVHPDYRSSTEGNDIAVLTLDRQLSYPTLPLASDPAASSPGSAAAVLGWGFTEEGGQASPTLQRAEVHVVPDPDCSTAYQEYDAAEMLCAGEPQGGADACNGDSGGPLVAGGRLIGVTSFGSGCGRAGLPGVYARVSTYAPLLEEQLR